MAIRYNSDALKSLKTNNDIDVYPYDKGSGFVLLKKEDAMSKIADQLGEAKKITKDPTKTLLTKFQRAISTLRKQGRFSNQQFFKIYPSDAVPPRMYGMVKAHKPQKNYPMRLVVSTVGTVSHGLAELLVDIIQPTLDKNHSRLKNSTTFANEAKEWEINSDEIQVSYDVVALYPSVPIKKAIDAIMNILQDDFDDVTTRTKLTLPEIRSLIELCMKKCYFLYDNDIYEIEDAGPIGLSLMVVIAEGYLQHLEKNALETATTRGVQPITFKRYVDDSHARFPTAEDADVFLELLNAQDPKIQYTIEKESDNKKLAFLDLHICNNGTGRYTFEVFRKDAITNVMIKPQSYINPRITDGVFKGFLARAHRLCSPDKLQEEIRFLIAVFVENGHSRVRLQKIADAYNPSIGDQGQGVSSQIQDTEETKVVKIPWVPDLGPKLRRVFKKYGIKTVFSSSPNLNTVLCSRNKCQLPPNSLPGVYKLDCSCGSSYIGETKKKISTRMQEHRRAIFNGEWTSSGATMHAKTCTGSFEWEGNTTIATERFYRRRKVRESLEIRRHEAKLNRDQGDHNTRSWEALFYSLDKVRRDTD